MMVLYYIFLRINIKIMVERNETENAKPIFIKVELLPKKTTEIANPNCAPLMPLEVVGETNLLLLIC